MPRVRKDGKTCTLPGCKLALYAVAMCDPHYRRWRLYGDPEISRPLGGPKLIPAELDAVITRRQRELWTQQGWLQPERQASGRYRWSDIEVEIAILMQRVAATGLPLPTAAKVARDAIVKGKTVHRLARGVTLEVS